MELSLRSYLKNPQQAFWDGKDGVAMRHVFDDFAQDMFCELHRPLYTTGGAYPSALAGEGDKERGVTKGVNVVSVKMSDSSSGLEELQQCHHKAPG